MSDHIKAELRSVMRQRRASLDTSRQQSAAIAVARHLAHLPGMSDARRIALYLPTDGEVDTSHLCSQLRDRDKQLYLPIVESGNTLSFAEWCADTTLVNNRYGIAEPPASATRRLPAELDIIIIPLVAWDMRCHRLGMGGGYYDRALADYRKPRPDGQQPVLVGVAHEVQRTERIGREQWDVTMDYIATEAALYRRRGEENAEVLFGDDNPGV